MSFTVNGQKCFVINYKDIALSNASGKNELALEFQQDPDSKQTNGDILCEMRFYVPTSELDNIEETDKKEEKKKEKKEKKDKGDNSEVDEDEEESDNEPEITPAKVLNDKIVKAAGLGEFAGDVIASLPDLPMIIPRGKYSLDFYSTFLKLHGRTHDYKILYKDIQKGFLLPKPDGVHMVFVLQLKSPLRQGQTLHHFIAVQLDKKESGRENEKVKINLSPEQIKQNYGDRLQPEMEGLLFDILSRLFKEIIKINILIPGEFRSFKGDDCIKCSVKAQDGHLYPLKSSLIFIHKPVIYIKHSEISFVELQRVGQVGAQGLQGSRSFDMTITKLSDGSQTTFAGIDREEFKNLTNYFKSKNVKIRQVDLDTNHAIEMSESDEELEYEESKGGRRAAKPAPGGMLDDEYDSEDDESFNEEGTPNESEESEEDDDDISMDDEEVDKEELAQMKKQMEENKNLGKRERKGLPVVSSKKSKKSKK